MKFEVSIAVIKIPVWRSKCDMKRLSDELKSLATAGCKVQMNLWSSPTQPGPPAVPCNSDEIQQQTLSKYSTCEDSIFFWKRLPEDVKISL